MRNALLTVVVLAVALTAAPAAADVLAPNTGAAVDPSVSYSTVKCEWCLTVAAAPFVGNCIDRSTGVAAPVLDGAKNVTIDNRSASTGYIEWDGSNVTATGTTGDKWAAGDKWSVDMKAIPFLKQATGAATATQTTGACMFVRQWK